MNTLFWNIFIYSIFEVSSLDSVTRPLKIQLDVVPHPALIIGGTKRAVLIEAFEGSGLCRLESPGISDVKFHGKTENFHISESDRKVHRIFLEAHDNSIASEKEKFEILVLCKETGTDILRTAKKEIQIFESFDSVISSDPHFVQAVYDEATKKTKTICYDVSGEAGDIIEILTQNSTKIVIQGELVDDNNMHLIKISYLNGKIISTTKGTKFSDGLSINWSEETTPQTVDRDAYSISFNGPTITIELKNKDEQIPNINFTLKRSYHTLTGYFVDIVFNNLVNYKGLGGLLGRVGNNRFIFFGSAQEGEEEASSSRSAVEVNGEATSSTLQVIGDLRCWMFDIEDVLYPSSFEEFISTILKWEP